jgi:hypothetical protein
MSKRSAKLAAAIAFGLASTFTLTAIPHTVHAADECLTEPKGATSPGRHWFYHVERGTGRKCWYQRGQDDGAASASSQDQSADASDDTSKDQDQAANDQAPMPIVRPPARRSEAPATRSIDDARAEWPGKTRRGDNSTAAPATTAAPVTTAAPATTSAAPVAAAPPTAASASVFPDPSTVLGAKPSADTPSSDQDTQPDTTASVAPEPEASPALVSQAAPVVDRQSTDPHHRASIPMLLMVAFGALGLAGLTGSTVYRLASVSRRRQDRWQRNVQLQPAPARRPRPVPARPEPIQQAIEEPIQDQFEDHRFAHDHDAHDHHAPADHDAPEQLQADHLAPEPAALELFAPRPRAKLSRAEPPRAETRTSDANGRRAQIEAHLAQLTRQLQADLAAPARAE